MSGNYYDPGNGKHVLVDGQIVEKDALHIAERIKEYDENLEIMCLDPMMSDFNDAPFVICERKPDGSLRKIFEAWELNNQILERIAQADNHLFDLNAKFDSINNVAEKLKADRYKDKQGATTELIESIVKDRKTHFSFKNDEGDLVTIHEDRPVQKGGRSYSYT